MLHKVIMVGSGGVGKSALTLQFMYDEVRPPTARPPPQGFLITGLDRALPIGQPYSVGEVCHTAVRAAGRTRGHVFGS